jgi:hypothetical protein
VIYWNGLGVSGFVVLREDAITNSFSDMYCDM